MKVMAQIAMVMNLDKCIGCHTCSGHLQAGMDEPRGHRVHVVQQRGDSPGYWLSQALEDQDHYKGGWVRKSNGKLVPRQGGRLMGLANIFANPNITQLDDYYEPWTYEYDKLLSAPKDSKGTPGGPRQVADYRRVHGRPRMGPELG